MTRFGIATLTETPAMTSALTPRLRRIGSRSVPAIGLSPCMRDNTKSSGCTSNASTTCVAVSPSSIGRGALRIAMNSRAFVLDPRPSGRRPAVQCSTGIPALRAAAQSLAPFGMTVEAAASASCGSAATGPITPFWHSLVTRASSVRSANTSESQHAARGELAGLEIVHRSLHVLQRIAGGHEFIELEATAAVEVDIAAYVTLWLGRAVAATGHGLVGVLRGDVEKGFWGGGG